MDKLYTGLWSTVKYRLNIHKYFTFIIRGSEMDYVGQHIAWYIDDI